MENIEREILNFKSQFLPFGSEDIRRATQVAMEVGEDGDWAGEQVLDFAESCEVSIDNIDPVYCVYESILQEARNEIEGCTQFDFCNDGADIYVAGNYLDTSFDWSDDAPETIKNKLIECEVDFNGLSKKTQWFLSEIGANY